jgi:tyrosinase
MHFPTLLSLTLLLGTTLALPQTQTQSQSTPKKYTPSSNNKCTTPSKRIEWRQMTSTDQQSYINSVLCLKTKPSRINLTTSLYDDFSYVHFNLSKQSMYQDLLSASPTSKWRKTQNLS